MYYVYILKSVKQNKFYKGITNNLEKRLEEHLRGKSKTTKIMLPVYLVHVELCATSEDARYLEKFFKSGYGREIIKELNDARVAER